MAFIEAPAHETGRAAREAKIKELGEALRKQEKPLIVPTEAHPIRASDIKATCPRQTYYNRLTPEILEGLHREKGAAVDGVVNAAAIYGTAVHTLLEQDAPKDRERFYGAWAASVNEHGAASGDKILIKWKTGSHPFKTVAFYRDADDEQRLEALYQRYLGLDRKIYQRFWKERQGWGEIETELVLTGMFRGAYIRTTADVVALTDSDERAVIDYKTGQPSEPTQLATYAMMAEARYGLEPGSIRQGIFLMTGSGVPIFERGKLPTAWQPRYADSVAVWELDEWRPIVKERVDKLLQFEKMGTWPPIYNMLCHNTCDHRFVCPIGIAVQKVTAEKEDADGN